MKSHVTLALSLIAMGTQACGYVGLELTDRDETLGSGGGESSGGDWAGDGDSNGDGDGSLGGTGESGGSGGSDESGGTGGEVATGGAGTTGTGGSDGTGGTGALDCWPFCAAQNASLISSYTFDLVMEHVAYLTLGASAKKSTEVVHHGARSQYFQQGSAGSEAELTIKFSAIEDGWVYVRAWVYVEEGSVSGDLKILGIDPPAGATTDVVLHPVGRMSLKLNTTNAVTYSELGTYPEGQWFCVQVGDYVSDTSGSVTVRVDEQTAIQVLDQDTQPVGGIDHLAYGIAATSNGQVNGKVYFDELIIDDEPIPCDLYAPNQ